VKHKKWLRIFADEIKNKKKDAIIEGIENEMFKETIKKKADHMRDAQKDGTF